MSAKRFRDNFIKTLPVMVGYLVLGIGFGFMLQEKGYGIMWALGMGATMYTGALQYVCVDFLANKTNLFTVAITAFMVNARYFVYSISMIKRFKEVKHRKPYLIFGLTDETFSIICSNEDLDENDMFVISLLDQIYWVISCVLGVLIGSLLPFDLTGCDFILTALFVAVVVDQWMSYKDHIPASLGLVSSVVCLLIFGKTSFMIPAIIITMVVLFLLEKFRKEKKQ